MQGSCEDRVLDGPASGENGSKGRNRGKRALRVGISSTVVLIVHDDRIQCVARRPRGLDQNLTRCILLSYSQA